MKRRVIIAGVVGNTLELYDYILFAYFAAVFSKLFFPASTPIVGLMKTYGIFASGFFMRPLGALFLGHIGDRWGRKRALEISIFLMIVPTVLTGLLPTYASVGVAAPLLLIALRLCQGFSVGGELVSSMSYMAEHAPVEERGKAGGWSLVGVFAGKVLGVLVFLILTMASSEAMLEQWTWRIPFLLGGVFGLAAIFVRRNLNETPVFEKMQKNKAPLRQALTLYRREILQAIGFTCCQTVAVYMIFTYVPVYLHSQWQLPYSAAMGSTLLSLLLVTVLLPWAGALSDRVGRLRQMQYGALVLAVLSVPSFWLMSSGNIALLFATQASVAIIFAVMHAPMAGSYIDLFPPELRNSAAGIAYNACVMVFGGLTPLLATWLIARSGNPYAPAYWLSLACLISTVSLNAMRREQPMQRPLGPAPLADNAVVSYSGHGKAEIR